MHTKEDIDNISAELLTLVFDLHSRIFNPTVMLKGLPIPPSNMKVIFYLTNSGPCPVSKIANDLMISKPNMTPIIDNLIAEGLVNRYDDPTDRRIIIVEATKEAYSFLQKKRQEMQELMAEKISILDENDLEALKLLLPRMYSIISKIK